MPINQHIDIAKPVQLPLKLASYECNFDNYIVGQNQLIIDTLKTAICSDAQYNLIYLWAQESTGGVGLSHLLHASYKLAQQQHSALYLPCSYLSQYSPELLHDLEQVKLICFDDIQHIITQPLWQEALFAYLNSAREQSSLVFITANIPVHLLECTLADLKTRLSAGLSLQVSSLDYEDKIQMMLMHAKQCGFDLPVAVAKFILNHYRRDIHSIIKLLDKLDKLSLSQHKKITISLVNNLLAPT
jgi:DnaA-homolog protein